MLHVTKTQTQTSLILTCYAYGEHVSITWESPGGFWFINPPVPTSRRKTWKAIIHEFFGYTVGTYTCKVYSNALCNIPGNRHSVQPCFPTLITRTVTVLAYGKFSTLNSTLEWLFYNFETGLR